MTIRRSEATIVVSGLLVVERALRLNRTSLSPLRERSVVAEAVEPVGGRSPSKELWETRLRVFHGSGRIHGLPVVGAERRGS